MNKKRRNLLLIAVLSIAVLTLAGCYVPRGTVDLNAPPDLWTSVIVFPLAKILIALNKFISGLGIPGSWGWAIIVFTIAIKIVTLPLTLKQMQSMKAQQQLQPRMREIQAKYGKDRQKLAEEQMKLYQEAGVSPMGGCLPMLVQMPILFGLYQALSVLSAKGVEQLQRANFLWIPDLSFPPVYDPVDPTKAYGTRWIGEAFSQNNWGLLVAYFSLPVIMLVTQVLQQKMSQPAKDGATTDDPQARMMGQMMIIMPVMFGYFSLGLPSGVTLYWTVSNLLAMIQQYFTSGWGGLKDWFPFLRKGGAAPVVVTTPAPATTPTAPRQQAPEKPVKRNRRRR